MRNKKVAEVDPEEVDLEREEEADEDNERSALARRAARRDDLSALADGMDSQSRTRAVEKILGYHAALRAELDKLGAQVGSQAETIARLEARLAAIPKGESPKNGKSKGETEVDYTMPENDRRVNDKLSFWERRSYSGPERRKRTAVPKRKNFLINFD